MGGSIEVASELGRGSCFTLSLMARRAQSDSVPPPSRGLSLPARRDFAGSGRILVAEDNPINRDVVGEFLGEFGCEVDFVSNGREAVEALERRRYALVLMDCQMPEMDGYEATRRIRAAESGHRTPIVACTAHAFEAEREKTEACGMDHFLSKPLTMGMLASVLERYLSPEGRARPHIVVSPTPSAFEGGPRRTPGLVRAFRTHVPGQIARLESAVANGDHADRKAAAHRLKGSCVAFGAQRMTELSRALEQDHEDHRTLVAELSRELTRVLAELPDEPEPLRSPAVN
jgi:CheY-like chemotaxis protein